MIEELYKIDSYLFEKLARAELTNDREYQSLKRLIEGNRNRLTNKARFGFY